MNVDDLARIRIQAEQHVAEIMARVEERFHEPALQRAELAEYDALTDEQHAAILQARGEDDYTAWAQAMEGNRQKWQTTGGTAPGPQQPG